MLELIDLYWPDLDISAVFNDDKQLKRYYLCRSGPVSHG
jgi:hypothetical protein